MTDLEQLKEFVAQKVWIIRQEIQESEKDADVKRMALALLASIFNELKTPAGEEITTIFKQPVKKLYEIVKPKE